MNKIHIEVLENNLSDDQLIQIMAGNVEIKLHESSRLNIRKCFDYINHRIHDTEDLIYGVNTGFGSLCNVAIPDDDVEQLQINLIRSHACGAGGLVPVKIGRLILFLKIRSLSYGYSGVSEELIDRLISLFNRNAIPVMYEQGSLGASGDLAPLAHLSLPLVGEGELYFKDEIITGIDYLKLSGQTPYHLKAKEGLALINGTQFSLSYLAAALIGAKQLFQTALAVAALSIEGFDCRMEPFSEQIHRIRPGNGQPEVARSIRHLLHGSQNMSKPKKHVQDPYSFRCIPQVHGATLKVLDHVDQIVHNEINSITDNPNIFVDDQVVLSGGNFHAQPLALASDYLSIATSELGSISERRSYLLISGQRDLPPFLTIKPGLESGFMIAQYTAAAIVSQNKQFATPASIDSIVSSNGQEDHVSMAANAGVKVLKIVENVWTLLAIEWQIAAQAVEMRRAEVSPLLDNWLKQYREFVEFLDHDRVLQKDFAKTRLYFESINYFAH